MSTQTDRQQKTVMIPNTVIYFESTTGLFIVHFDDDKGKRHTGRYSASIHSDMVRMGKDVAEWER